MVAGASAGGYEAPTLEAPTVGGDEAPKETSENPVAAPTDAS